MREVKVIGVALDTTEQHVILLGPVEIEDEEGPLLPIWVGAGEATSILLGAGNLSLPRPLTHDLIHSILETLNISVESVQITSLEEGTFLAVINLLNADHQSHIVDARPSDAIGIAIRTGAPIFVSDAVFNEASIENLFDDSETSGASGSAKPADTSDASEKIPAAPSASDLKDFMQFREFLDQVSPEDFVDEPGEEDGPTSNK